MGTLYAAASIELLVAEHGDLTQSELSDLNARSYPAVPSYLKEKLDRIKQDGSLFGFVKFKDGKYVLTSDKDSVQKALQNIPLHNFTVQIAFFARNYKPSFWQKEIE